MPWLLMKNQLLVEFPREVNIIWNVSIYLFHFIFYLFISYHNVSIVVAAGILQVSEVAGDL